MRSGRIGQRAATIAAMALKLQLSDENLLADLMGSLANNGCLTNRVAPTACKVVYPLALDSREAWLEVGFFVRAWQIRHPGVQAVLSI
jgi:hypothetical protein